jgi:hypothetical protein
MSSHRHSSPNLLVDVGDLRKKGTLTNSKNVNDLQQSILSTLKYSELIKLAVNAADEIKDYVSAILQESQKSSEASQLGKVLICGRLMKVIKQLLDGDKLDSVQWVSQYDYKKAQQQNPESSSDAKKKIMSQLIANENMSKGINNALAELRRSFGEDTDSVDATVVQMAQLVTKTKFISRV